MKRFSVKVLVLVLIVAVVAAVFATLWPKRLQKPGRPQLAEEQKAETKKPEAVDELKRIEQRIALAEETQEVNEVPVRTMEVQAKQPPMLEAGEVKILDEGVPTLMNTLDGNELPIALGQEDELRGLDRELVADEPNQIVLSPEQQRHRELHERLTKELSPPYSKEQLEQRRKELLQRLPAHYRELLEKIDEMKKAELEKRRQQQWQSKRFNRLDPNYMLKPSRAASEKPTFSNDRTYSDKNANDTD